MTELKSDGGPAFPRAELIQQVGGGSIDFHSTGMSLRDWFAGQALLSLLDGKVPATTPDGQIQQAIAVAAYWVADAMLKARDK